MIRIDGSAGEGGGQILRTSLSLSLATGKPFTIENIRANRQKPGLLRQHLTAVEAATKVGSARVEGAYLGSSALTFVPGTVKGGEYHFTIGTAGSTTLVLQTILPALMLASEPSEVVIEGGTHNTMAPPYDFLEKTFVPLVNRMGPKVELQLNRYGFYPAGGGRITATIQPCNSLAPLYLGARGEIVLRRCVAKAASLPRHIPQREIETVGRTLGWPAEQLGIEETKNAASPGNVVTIEIGDTNATIVFTAFGRLGASAEKVAHEAIEQAEAYLASTAVADEHLADQLLLPIALAGGGSFTAERLSSHADTNMRVIRQFLPVDFAITDQPGCELVELKNN